MAKSKSSYSEPLFQWDYLIRFIHWSVAILFFVNHFITDPEEFIHEYVGYAIAVLVAIRLLWAIIPLSAKRAKLSALKPSVAKIKSHLVELKNGKFKAEDGHNPLGALMVIAIWSFLFLAVLSGYMQTTDWGIDNDVEQIHEFFVNFLIPLVVIHIFSVVFLSLRFKTKLIKTMLFSSLKSRK